MEVKRRGKRVVERGRNVLDMVKGKDLLPKNGSRVGLQRMCRCILVVGVIVSKVDC